ncbi:MAG: nuclease [Acidobacteria bacterium]|nr:nuclease [Acidobacteriota bacterium]
MLVALLLAGAVPSSAWGPAGHRVVAEMAVPSLPVFFPSFVRQNEALILFLSLEPDRWRDAGQSPLQAATAPDHYIEFEKLSFLPTLPPDRYRFYQDLFERRRQLRARRRLREADALLPQRVGLQPYATAEVYGRLVIAWQQYQQAVTTRARSTAQQAVLFYMGWLAHYVADGAQPLHTTQHSDGWFGPNPNGYSTRPGLHAKTEDAFINQSGLEGSLRSQRVQPQRLQDPFADYVAYLRASFALVPRLYDLEKAGAFDGNGTAEGKDFIAKRLTAAAAMVAGLWVNAYETSRTPP